ncbi:fumarylacetoacetate hydrolase family protein [Terriglobus tenax]|uniref:fumarylacetoacetate hydrolase family protein n=1 Tax=Terriglobus tenax TaxID=1111115 RepID=UPI0021E06870|nr:fumarylacetoacetate hydrolase family protein [Terriglobus tenax]
MKLYRTSSGIFVESGNAFYPVEARSWDELISSDVLLARATAAISGTARASLEGLTLLAPVESQEVWASGVTYYRSRSARMEESKDAGGGDFYDRVYYAERPELFFKSAGRRVIGSGGNVRIRRDASWSVPEPELTLLLSPSGNIAGYTIGNDMSSRDIEGQNPLYLPQAKNYDGACALGPCVLLASEPLPKTTTISIQILRKGEIAFTGETTLAEIKREFTELAGYLFRESSFPDGVFLMTGTGVVPPDIFTLAIGDRIRISIAGIGTLENTVA